MGQASEPSADVLRSAARLWRTWIIQRSYASNVGHIGSALSIVDMMAALWGGVMHRAGTSDPDRDRFILGKGHASLALYCALRWKDLMDEAVFDEYCSDGGQLGVHPEHALAGVDVSTGSLGQSLSVGCGLALGLRQQGRPSRTFVLMSDAECNEGQIWEAAMFASHHGLGNLTGLIDLNGQQAMGRTPEILDLGSMAAKWRAFGWKVHEVDGHDLRELLSALLCKEENESPSVVVARTVLGKGVSFMEDDYTWHYRNLTPEESTSALRELEGEQ